MAGEGEVPGAPGERSLDVRRVTHRLLPWLLGGGIVLLDQITKAVVLNRLEPGRMVTVVYPYVQFVHVRNPGVAFGLDLGALSRPFFIFSSLMVLGVLVLLYRSTRPDERLKRVALVVLCAGAVGNLIDRIRWAEGVVDFIRVSIWNREWPIFNLADVAVTAGAVMLGIALLAATRRTRHF